MLKGGSKILQWVNESWCFGWLESKWSFVLNRFWKGPGEPKKKCLVWKILLKRVAVGDVLSSLGLSPLVCSVFSTLESISHIFFECPFASLLWSLFLGSPVRWNSRPGLSWCEVLVGFIDCFDDQLNTFWSVLCCEVLWSKQNEDV